MVGEELSKQRPYEGGGSSDHLIAVQILKWGECCTEEVCGGGMLTAHVGQVQERGIWGGASREREGDPGGRFVLPLTYSQA